LASALSLRGKRIAEGSTLAPPKRLPPAMICSQKHHLLGQLSEYPDNRERRTLWQRWVQRPQSLLFRKLLFQAHLWVGIGVGLYVAVISVSGSAIVCRREIGRIASRRITVATPAGRRRVHLAEIEQNILRAYPGYEILSLRESEQVDRPDLAVLENRNERIARFFDPYTGADLGDPRPAVVRLLGWLADLHDNLLAGLTGRTFNGIGAFLVLVMGATGAVIWWPGIKNSRRSMWIQRGARFARLNWDLHSAVGFWCLLFVVIWGVSGICLCFPGTLDSLLSYRFRLWINRLHFGRFNGATEALWTVLGLAPGILAITGALMWWNRVLSKKLRRIAGIRL
jgi:uncharacterized iron-regulated membrane protein